MFHAMGYATRDPVFASHVIVWKETAGFCIREYLPCLPTPRKMALLLCMTMWPGQVKGGGSVGCGGVAGGGRGSGGLGDCAENATPKILYVCKEFVFAFFILWKNKKMSFWGHICRYFKQDI